MAHKDRGASETALGPGRAVTISQSTHVADGSR